MNKNRRLEILGILIVSISVFFLISLVGYNANEEPSISPNVKIENPMGILGVFISHFLIKLSFGFASITIPIVGAIWGWFLFSKKKIRENKIIYFILNINHDLDLNFIWYFRVNVFQRK